jgi:rhomboid protease GluP
LLRCVLSINIAFFVISLLLLPGAGWLTWNPLLALAPTTRSLILLGATGTLPIAQFGRWWTLLTAGYLHGSIVHLAFNMLALRQLAPIALTAFGMQRTTVIYTLGSVGGFYVSFLAGVRLTIGASAALCALMGALLYYGRSRGGPFGQALYRQIGGWVIGIIVFGLLVPGINNWGHGGGLGVGLALGGLLGHGANPTARGVLKPLAAACWASTALALAWALVGAAGYRFFGA